MRLSRFINDHIQEILVEWQSFAESLGPAADKMSTLALRDHAKAILQTIAVDIESWQNPEKQYEKSQGLATDEGNEQSAASIHGALREASDFSLLQLSAEFRALRATVLRLWLPRVTQMSATTTYEMVRFNEAIDQALAESIITYSAHAEHTRDLFLAVLGHDLRAPLSTMATACELLLHTELPSDQIEQTAVRVRRSTRLMSSMVNDLLGYTRLQMGRGMPIKLKPVNIEDVCQSAIEDAQSLHPSCQFALHTQGDLAGSFDDVRLHQLLTNLLVNAAQYGTKEQPIILDAQGEADAVTIRVTNFGPVIPEESMGAIFKPLVQLSTDEENDTRPRTSLGLGLFVAREIAIAHGGTIAVQSNETDGTTFTVVLQRTVG